MSLVSLGSFHLPPQPHRPALPSCIADHNTLCAANAAGLCLLLVTLVCIVSEPFPALCRYARPFYRNPTRSCPGTRLRCLPVLARTSLDFPFFFPSCICRAQHQPRRECLEPVRSRCVWMLPFSSPRYSLTMAQLNAVAHCFPLYFSLSISLFALSFSFFFSTMVLFFTLLSTCRLWV